MSTPAQKWMDIYFDDLSKLKKINCHENADIDTIFAAMSLDEKIEVQRLLPYTFQLLYYDHDYDDREIYQLK